MRALVIEDDDAVAGVVCRGLERHGYTVTRAADGEYGVEIGSHEEFDSCLLDLNLPGLSGLDVLDRLRKRTSRVPPVIVLTGEATTQAAVESMRRGASDFITKPFSLIELLKSVEITLARAAMEKENEGLRKELSAGRDEELVGESPSMRALIERARSAARSSASILITGGTGTGKSLLARKIHDWSERSSDPFVAISCAALPSELVESELFGHEKGAFTGAVSTRKGRFGLAANGTLFLDEIGELPLTLQPKLLRVLQSGEFEPIGSKGTMVSNARIITATNCDLQAAIAKREFREDLYFRLNVVALKMPTLRERAGDIELLTDRFLHYFARTHGKLIEEVEPSALAALCDCDWPGNVRQLRNAIERAVVFADGAVLQRSHLEIDPNPATTGQAEGTSPEHEFIAATAHMESMPLAVIERHAIELAVDDCNGCREDAAERLGVSLSTLYRRLREYRKSDERMPERAA